MPSTPRPVRRHATAFLVATTLLTTACGSTAHRDRLALADERASSAPSEHGTAGTTPDGGVGTNTGPGTSPTTNPDGSQPSTSPDGTTTVPGHGSPSTSPGGSTIPGTTTPGGSTGGSSGQPTSPSAAGLPQTSENSRGATADTIKIGMTYISSFQSLGSSLGFTVPAKGDVPAQAQALADWVNANGGIAGRQVEMVVRGFKQEESGPGLEQQLCNAFADDEGVFAVGLLGQVQESTRYCYASKRVLAIDMTTYTYDTTVFAENAPYLWSLQMADYAALARTLPVALNEAKYFEPMASRNETETKIGVLTWDQPFAKRVAARDLEPALKKVGQEITVLSTVDGSSIGTIQKGLSDAVVKFRDAGVNRVMFVGGAPLQVFFFQTAENEEFRPRYGMTSIEQPRFTANPDEGGYPLQAHDAVGIGVAPDVDVEDDQMPLGTMNASEKECLDVLAAAGHDHDARKNANVALGICGVLMMLQQGAATITDGITPELWAAHAEKNLANFVGPLTEASNFGPGDHAGPSHFRPLRWFEDCACFRYTGPLRPLL